MECILLFQFVFQFFIFYFFKRIRSDRFSFVLVALEILIAFLYSRYRFFSVSLNHGLSSLITFVGPFPSLLAL